MQRTMFAATAALFAIGFLPMPVLSPSSYALETTATGALNNEASWSALRNMVDNANSRVTILQTQLNAAGACGKAGKLWNGTGCTDIPSAPKWKTQSIYGGGGYSGVTWVSAGWHTLCTIKFHHDSSNHTLTIVGGPDANGKFNWAASGCSYKGCAEPQLLCLD